MREIWRCPGLPVQTQMHSPLSILRVIRLLENLRRRSIDDSNKMPVDREGVRVEQIPRALVAIKPTHALQTYRELQWPISKTASAAVVGVPSEHAYFQNQS